MVCGNCGNCQNIQVNGERYSIACTRGAFELHESHADDFKCEDYVEYVQPPRDNVLVILKSGRDITTCENGDIDLSSEWVKIGNLLINKQEIAVIVNS